MSEKTKMTIDMKTTHIKDENLIYIDIDSVIKASIFGMESTDKEAKKTHDFYFSVFVNALLMTFDNDKKKVIDYLSKIAPSFRELEL
jgi:hypothetical protein